MSVFTDAPTITSSPEERNDHLAFTADLVRKELWEVQLAEYPTSVQLTVQEVMQWACNDIRRLRCISSALQKDACVWYHIPGMGEVTGCRYGWEASNYISGFSDF